VKIVLVAVTNPAFSMLIGVKKPGSSLSSDGIFRLPGQEYSIFRKDHLKDCVSPGLIRL
jgi:hypothetical protein